MNNIEYLYTIYNNVLDMLLDRKYKVPKSVSLSFKDFKKKYVANNYNITLTHTHTRRKIYVLFNLHNKSKLQYIKQLLIDTYETYPIDTTDIMLILHKKPNNIIKKFIRTSLYSDTVELFWLSILQINITKHILQPRFRLLQEEEKQNVLQKYNVTIQQLPKMSLTDPIAKYYKYPKHAIIEIIRTSRDCISSVSYRYIS